FGDRSEYRAVIELLEGLALAHLARNLADEQNERGGILTRDMHSPRRIGGAGPARDEADARPPGGLAAGFRHDGGPALLPANGDGDIAVVEGIERRDIALAGHAKHVAHPMNDELVDQNFAGGPSAVVGAHHASPMALPLAFTPCRKRARGQNRVAAAGDLPLRRCRARSRKWQRSFAGTAPALTSPARPRPPGRCACGR